MSTYAAILVLLFLLILTLDRPLYFTNLATFIKRHNYFQIALAQSLEGVSLALSRSYLLSVLGNRESVNSITGTIT